MIRTFLTRITRLVTWMEGGLVVAEESQTTILSPQPFLFPLVYLCHIKRTYVWLWLYEKEIDDTLLADPYGEISENITSRNHLPYSSLDSVAHVVSEAKSQTPYGSTNLEASIQSSGTFLVPSSCSVVRWLLWLWMLLNDLIGLRVLLTTFWSAKNNTNHHQLLWDSFWTFLPFGISRWCWFWFKLKKNECGFVVVVVIGQSVMAMWLVGLKLDSIKVYFGRSKNSRADSVGGYLCSQGKKWFSPLCS